MTMRNSLLNMDGMGVAWYTKVAQEYLQDIKGARPALYKSQSPPFNDFNFRSLCSNTQTHCCFAHIRATSGSVVTQVNSHPFVFGRHTFMHNGVVSNFTNIRREKTNLLSYDAFCNVLGSTDSEHAAALYMTNLTKGGTKDTWEKEYPIDAMREALIKTLIQIMELQQKIMGDKKAPNSLNFCTTDGRKMVSCRFRNHVSQQPPSLYWSEFAGRTLNHKYPGHPDKRAENPNAFKTLEEHGKHTIIASEPTTYDEDEWHLIGKNCVLQVDEQGTETEIPIKYDGSLNAVDPSNP